MNTALKNVLLTIVIALWLGFIGYSLSCFVAYLIGWTPIVAPIIFMIISAIAIISGLISRNRNVNLKSMSLVIFFSLFISSLGNTIIQGIKFEDNMYRGSIIGSRGYLYDQFGFKILNVQGRIRYNDDVVYVETNKQVYALDYNGDLYANEEFVVADHQGRAIVLRHPFTNEYLIKKESDLIERGYEDYDYLGETEVSDFFKCYKNGLWDLVKVGKKYGGNVEFRQVNDIQEFGNPIRCFVIKDRKEYVIISSDGLQTWKEKNGVNNPYYDYGDNRLRYKDDDGQSWYCQLEN